MKKSQNKKNNRSWCEENVLQKWVQEKKSTLERTGEARESGGA